VIKANSIASTMESRASTFSQGPPPPYGDDSGVALPGYEDPVSPTQQTHGEPSTSPPPAPTTTPPTSTSRPSQPTSSTAPEAASTRKPSATSFLTSARDALTSCRRGKDLDRKVQFYEKMYGFVPKNVMSEAEWAAARKAAPKERKKGQLKQRLYFGPPGG
jgi:hypothetical protein